MNATFDWFSFAFDIMFDSCYDWLILRLAILRLVDITFVDITFSDITFGRYYVWASLQGDVRNRRGNGSALPP
jgi:hypothetical protein